MVSNREAVVSGEEKKTGVAAVMEGVARAAKAVEQMDMGARPKVEVRKVTSEKDAGSVLKDLLSGIETKAKMFAAKLIFAKDFSGAEKLAQAAPIIEDSGVKFLRNFADKGLNSLKKLNPSAPISVDLNRQLSEDGNPRLVEALALIGAAPESLRDDPKFLLWVGARLRSQTNYLTSHQAQAETTNVLGSILRYVSAETKMNLADQQMYLGQMLIPHMRMGMMPTPPGAPTHADLVRGAIDDLYKPSGDTVTDTAMVNALKGFQRVMKIDPDRYDAQLLREVEQAAKQKIFKDGDDPIQLSQAEQVLKRVRNVESLLAQGEKARRMAEAGRTGEVNFGILEKLGIHNPLRKEDAGLTFRYITQEEVVKILSGYEGLDEVFTIRVASIVGMGPEQARKTLMDEYWWQEIESLMKYSFPEDQEYKLNPFKKSWDTLGRVDGAVKHVFYGPGGLEDKLKGMRMTPADLQDLAATEHFNDVFGLYGEGIRDTLLQERIIRTQAQEWMAQTETNRFYDAGDKYGLGEKLNKTTLRRDEYIHVLRKMAAEGSEAELVKFGKLTEVEHNLLNDKMEKYYDIVNKGVMLRDAHMLNHGTVYQDLAKNIQEYQTIKLKNPRDPRLVELDKKIRGLWGDYTKNPDEWRGPNDEAELTALAGYSPMEIRARDLVMKKFNELGMKVPEWKIRRAVKAVRDMYIVSGEAAVIGARMAIPAGIYGYRPQDKMNRAFLEPLQRVINPELFMEDFGMGGHQGERAREIWNYLIMKYKGGTEFMNDPKWKEILAKSTSPEDQRFVEMVEFAQKALGTEFTELFRTGFLKGGLQFDQSHWRLNVAVLQEIREKMSRLRMEGKLPADAVLDNVGLGLQLLATGLSEGDQKLRYKLMLKIMQREPSIMFQILGKDMDAIVAGAGVDPNGAEYRKFRSALTIAQQKLWKDEDLMFRSVDLAKKADFDRVVGTTLESMGVIDPAQRDKFRKIIEKMQGYMKEKHNGSTPLEFWSKHDWPMTLTLSDFDMSDADFMKVGAYSIERRINDFIGMSKAMGNMFELMYDSKYWSPQGEKGITEMLGKIKELRGAIDGYDGPDTAEKASKAMLHLIIEMNRNRAIWKIGWIPGGITIAKNLAELDLRWLSDNKVLNKLTGGEWKKLAGEKIHHWPHSVAEWLSYSAAFTGEHGNAWGEAKILEVINQADAMGIFSHNRDYVHDLKNEMRVTLPWRTMAMFRRYWWVPFVASAALAVAQATDDEKRKSEKGG